MVRPDQHIHLPTAGGGDVGRGQRERPRSGSSGGAGLCISVRALRILNLESPCSAVRFWLSWHARIWKAPAQQCVSGFHGMV